MCFKFAAGEIKFTANALARKPMRQKSLRNLLPSLLMIGLTGLANNALAVGGIIRDGTLPGLPPQTFKPIPKTNEISIHQSDGVTKGPNLFHSFKQFNIARGQTVTFYENKPNSLDNVIARVTGNSRSDINGRLAVTPDGKANFYLINPNGIIFGPGSSVDIKGSIHVSTADYIKFKDGNTFSATQPAGNTLSSATPSAFGFLGTSTQNNGLLKIDSSTIAINEGNLFDGVAGRIVITNSNSKKINITVPEGEIRLVAAKNKATISLLTDKKGRFLLPKEPTLFNSGKIELKNAFLEINDDGYLTIWGNELIMDSSLIDFTNNEIRNSSLKQGVLIHVVSMFIGNNSTINTFGKSGNISILTSSNITLNNGKLLTKSTFTEEATGNISVKSGGTIQVSNSGEISTGVVSSSGFGAAKAGDIYIKAKNDIVIDNGGILRTTNSGGTVGSLGNITIISYRNLYISDLNPEFHGTKISTSTDTGVDAGNINLDVKGNITLSGGQIDSSSSGFATGNAGSILIKADGNIAMDKGTNLASDTEGAGKGGRVRIQADDISLTNSQISTRSTGIKAAGNIDILFSGRLSLYPSFITTEANQGNGGNVTIKGGNLIVLKDSAVVTTVKGVKGNGGNVNINAKNLVLDTGLIQANTQALGGSGGIIDLELQGLIASGNTLTLGGSPSVLQPGRFGFNFIQAAAPNGINGPIRSTAPQLNLSAELANLGTPKFDKHFLSPGYCDLGTGSSLTRISKGGLMRKGSEVWLY
jgi:filamentous hemagglutinin family protein